MHSETDAKNQSDTESQSQESPEIPGVFYFLRQKKIAIIMFALTIIWIAATFNYYTMSFLVKNLSGDFNTNTVAIYCSDLFVSLVGWLFVSYLKPEAVMYIFCIVMMSGMGALFWTKVGTMT